jgi:hypothetical protein
MLRFWERTPERLREHRTRHRLDGSVQVTHEQRLVQQKMTMHPPDPTRIFNWKREMRPAECDEFVCYAGDTLRELGYEV